MTSKRVPSESDPILPGSAAPISIEFDGVILDGVAGQTIAGVLLGSGILSWRVTSDAQKPRGVFCGIGICFDCLVAVNGLQDVRACQRRARDGDVVTTQFDALPEPGRRS